MTLNIQSEGNVMEKKFMEKYKLRKAVNYPERLITVIRTTNRKSFKGFMMLERELNILFFSFFFTLLISFSLQARSLQSNINQPYGLFFVEADKLKEEKEIFAAPTLKTDVHVDVQGLLTTTTVKQYFINPTNTWMEAIYLFPLPDKSAVDFLRMKIGDRFIEGKIQEKVEAEKTYEKAKKIGKKASLVSSSRANIFKTKVANIAPGELIIIEIRYHDILTLKNDIYSLRIPTVINHRYTHSKKSARR